MPSFAAANNGVDRPGDAKYEFVTAGFWDCTTPDGHEWYCTSPTDLSACQQVKLQVSTGITSVHPVIIVHPEGANTVDPGSNDAPSSHLPTPVAGFAVVP